MLESLFLHGPGPQGTAAKAEAAEELDDGVLFFYLLDSKFAEISTDAMFYIFG